MKTGNFFTRWLLLLISLFAIPAHAAVAYQYEGNPLYGSITAVTNEGIFTADYESYPIQAILVFNDILQPNSTYSINDVTAFFVGDYLGTPVPVANLGDPNDHNLEITATANIQTDNLGNISNWFVLYDYGTLGYQKVFKTTHSGDYVSSFIFTGGITETAEASNTLPGSWTHYTYTSPVPELPPIALLAFGLAFMTACRSLTKKSIAPV
ncbi:hypothetical protein LG204_01775 [Methylovorus menthalis]|uniref:hypothetical protein n=1 Tax=Methylovorus menthalis TaxID=1002227 RepID=UPI001E4D6A66|nr:hypothetical protein [Methylovorus menthalis]MCB4810041.1 hypothetical protein [Methylovorus menthalis]